MITEMTIGEILNEYPFTEEFFEQNRLDVKGHDYVPDS